MKLKKPIIIHLPELLIKELNVYLRNNKPNFKYDIVYFYYIIHYLTIGMKRKDDGFVIINQKILKSITISNIGRYITILINGEFIKSNNTYRKGKVSLGYKINPILKKGIKRIEIKTDSKMFDKIIKHKRKEKAHYNRLEPFLIKMKNEFMKLEIDYEKSNNWIIDNAKENEGYHITALYQIMDKRFRYFKRNKTNNRLDTNLTNLRKEITSFIKGNYVSIDLSNSQPFLLSLVLNHIVNKQTGVLCSYLDYFKLLETFGKRSLERILLIHQNREKSKMVNLKAYSDSTLEGLFYDRFISLYNDKGISEVIITRKEVKQMMFTVLFSKNEVFNGNGRFIPYKKEKEIFSSVYPFVYDAVKILKTKNNKILPIYLQRFESFLFIDCIAKELVANNIIPFTIHDSVIVKQVDEVATLKIMKRIFLEQTGVIPSFDIENLKNR